MATDYMYAAVCLPSDPEALLEVADAPAELLEAIIGARRRGEGEGGEREGEEEGVWAADGGVAYSRRRSRRTRTLLMTAAKYGRGQCCAMLLCRYPQCLHTKNSRSYNALHFSCYGGNRDTSLLLLGAGSNPFELNKYGETCSEAALNGGHFELSNLIRLEALCPVAGSRCPVSYATSLADAALLTRCDNLDSTRRLASSQWLDADPPAPFGYFHSAAYGADGGTTEPSAQYATLAPKPSDRDQSQRFYLEVASGDAGAEVEVGACFELSPALYVGAGAGDIYIGRSGANAIQLTDMSISKRHASLSFHSELGFYVRDLGSVHGTFVNGVKIIPEKCIATGDDTALNNHLLLTENIILKLGRLSLVLKRRVEPTVMSNRYCFACSLCVYSASYLTFSFVLYAYTVLFPIKWLVFGL
jgi:hypothetical protein